MDCIASKPPTDKDYRQLQIECKEISKPFIEMMVGIYNRSPFSLLYSPSQPEIAPTIFYAHEHEAEAVRIHMKAAIDLHIASWCKRFGAEDIREAVKM